MCTLSYSLLVRDLFCIAANHMIPNEPWRLCRISWQKNMMIYNNKNQSKMRARTCLWISVIAVFPLYIIKNIYNIYIYALLFLDQHWAFNFSSSIQLACIHMMIMDIIWFILYKILINKYKNNVVVVKSSSWSSINQVVSYSLLLGTMTINVNVLFIIRHNQLNSFEIMEEALSISWIKATSQVIPCPTLNEWSSCTEVEELYYFQWVHCFNQWTKPLTKPLV